MENGYIADNFAVRLKPVFNIVVRRELLALKSERQRLRAEKERLDENAGLVNETRLLADFRSDK